MTRHAIALASLLLLSACAVGPDYVRPDLPMPASYLSPPADHPAASNAWWQRFGDELLDELVREAQEGNLSLAAARSRFDAARAFSQAARNEYLPSGGAEISGERGRRSSLELPAGADRQVRRATAGISASWEADVLGRVSRSVESAKADEEAEEALLQDAVRVLVAELARAYVALRFTQQRLEIAAAALEAQRQTRTIVQAKLEVGRGNAFDVARAEVQLAGTAAQLPALRAEERAWVLRIASLCGKTPESFLARLGAGRALSTPSLAGVGSPMDLLLRRPDLRAAERRLAAATARIGVVTAELYPRVSLDASAGWLAPNGSGLGESAFGLHSLIPRISWAFLDIPRVRSRIQAAGAQAQEASASFRHQVLHALEETEQAISAYSQQQERMALLRSQVTHADQATRLASQRYRDGVSSFLDVLDAERSSLDAKDRWLLSQQEVASHYIAVHSALGG